MEKPEIEKLEMKMLLDAMAQCHGYDFRNYSPASLKRRIRHFMAKSGCREISELIPRLLHDRAFFDELLIDITVTVTEMFRDPAVYLALRTHLLPILKTYPSLRIWHAGCSTGEEVYSMAILLEEEGLLGRTQIYATDINETALKQAKSGIYSVEKIKEYTVNYQKAGGRRSLSDYYHARYDSVIMRKSLSEKITFASHNLISDSSFGAMHLICCRNVLIYFDEVLQNRVLKLFMESLVDRGFILLGTKESLLFSEIKELCDKVPGIEKCYQVK